MMPQELVNLKSRAGTVTRCSEQASQPWTQSTLQTRTRPLRREGETAGMCHLRRPETGVQKHQPEAPLSDTFAVLCISSNF